MLPLPGESGLRSAGDSLPLYWSIENTVVIHIETPWYVLMAGQRSRAALKSKRAHHACQSKRRTAETVAILCHDVAPNLSHPLARLFVTVSPAGFLPSLRIERARLWERAQPRTVPETQVMIGGSLSRVSLS
jgi:hypothetical protein